MIFCYHRLLNGYVRERSTQQPVDGGDTYVETRDDTFIIERYREMCVRERKLDSDAVQLYNKC